MERDAGIRPRSDHSGGAGRITEERPATLIETPAGSEGKAESRESAPSVTFWEWVLEIGIAIAVLAIGVALVVFRTIDRVLGFFGTIALAGLAIESVDYLVDSEGERPGSRHPSCLPSITIDSASYTKAMKKNSVLQGQALTRLNDSLRIRRVRSLIRWQLCNCGTEEALRKRSGLSKMPYRRLITSKPSSRPHPFLARSQLGTS